MPSPRTKAGAFPSTLKFRSKSELATYFNREKLTCLICGHRYIQLVAHIGPAHRLSADEYKERFGIPWTYGLAGKTFKANSARRIKSTRKSGKLPARPSKAHIARLVEAAKGRRASVAAVSSDNRRKILKTHKQSRKWGPPEFSEFLKRIASGRTPTDVGRDVDLPTAHWFRRYIAQDIQRRKKFEAVWNRVPYSIQAKNHKLSPKFTEELVALRRKGLLWREVAAKLGVTQTTARQIWHKLKRANALKKTDLIPKPNKFSHSDYVRYLEEIAKGKGLRDLSKNPRRPSVAQFYRYLRQSPALQKKHSKIARTRMRNRN